VTIQLLPAFILGAITVIAVLCLIFRWSGLKKVRSFYVWIGVLAVLGGAWAFLFPLAINADFSKNGDGAALRQTLIYTAGGLLGVITLGETRHKNDQEHMRQVHAERRSRYGTAIEQLADEKAPIRLGGVYTLVKLVDDWLDDEKTLPSKDERRKEGQIIIDSLCAYIRSSFPLAERYDELTLSYEEYQQNCQGNQDLHNPQIIPLPKPKNAKQSREDFMRDKSLLREEQEVRKTILSEIKNRLNGGKTKNKDDRDEIEPGTWSYFEYDFSNAIFFYSANFSNSLFGASSNFTQAAFTEGADFSGAKFTQNANFSRATFTGVIFFAHGAYFSGAKFTQNANFSGATFTGLADFSGAAFQTEPIFESILDNEARFSCKVHPESYNFEVSYDSPYKIETEEKEYNGTKFTIPKGTILFDPDGSSE